MVHSKNKPLYATENILKSLGHKEDNASENMNSTYTQNKYFLEKEWNLWSHDTNEFRNTKQCDLCLLSK